jgi:hypothetical protein
LPITISQVTHIVHQLRLQESTGIAAFELHDTSRPHNGIGDFELLRLDRHLSRV